MVDTGYHDDLEEIIDSAEARTAALLLSVLLSEYGVTAASKFSISNAFKLLKTVKNKKIANSFDISITPAVIAAIDLLRENKTIGSVYDIAKNSVYKVANAADRYYNERAFQAVDDRERSARMAARWLVRDAVFTGQTEAAIRLGLTKKRWVTRQDSRVRHSHASLDGVVVDISERFITQGGVAISFPGDVRAPLSEVINCRCSLEFL
ncbi:MuF-like minor capsid protein [Gordonia phage Forza]|uniref:MuF-like minor capsid protein n=1 Tax=Gordonia phage Forza TaxID=2571247 RepID=A0A650EZG7_9CAUD|nr:head morphogenesis [Gordonia phage Forza]QEM41544.1 MuF-like minor capsid protein [Gordonia phage Boopy]QGT55068.1 MuF-like minor capsid protein [Gordonia phage Forza]UXE04217.1 hypothetical protein SEA_BLUENGOLD_73 [Gordonia phage BlueNGold]WBF03856.1 hypothetical protein SEA_MAREELIH_73 [Gordonia phage Mareelih]